MSQETEQYDAAVASKMRARRKANRLEMKRARAAATEYRSRELNRQHAHCVALMMAARPFLEDLQRVGPAMLQAVNGEARKHIERGLAELDVLLEDWPERVEIDGEISVPGEPVPGTFNRNRRDYGAKVYDSETAATLITCEHHHRSDRSAMECAEKLCAEVIAERARRVRQ